MPYIIMAHDHKDALPRRMESRQAHMDALAPLKADGKVLYAAAILNDNGDMAGRFPLPRRGRCLYRCRALREEQRLGRYQNHRLQACGSVCEVNLYAVIPNAVGNLLFVPHKGEIPHYVRNDSDW